MKKKPSNISNFHESEKLKNNPRYRFTYQDNLLLDRIFNGELDVSQFDPKTQETVNQYLLQIDPT